MNAFINNLYLNEVQNDLFSMVMPSSKIPIDNDRVTVSKQLQPVKTSVVRFDLDANTVHYTDSPPLLSIGEEFVDNSTLWYTRKDYKRFITRNAKRARKNATRARQRAKVEYTCCAPHMYRPQQDFDSTAVPSLAYGFEPNTMHKFVF